MEVLVVVVLDEGLNGSSVRSFLGTGVVPSTANVIHALMLEAPRHIMRDVGRAVIIEQPRLVIVCLLGAA